jgi:CRP-like cAMP-binding protein
VNRREIFIDDKKRSPELAFILLAGVARITCRNRKGDRTVVIMVASGMIPGFPPPVPGIRYNFRCEAVTPCQVGTIELKALIEIALGISSDDFKQMAASYLGRWDLVQLRCANFMSCRLEERIVLTLLELAENFGVKDERSIRLTIPTRHRDLAELVGVSRPRVTEFLLKFERDKLISRGAARHLIIHPSRMEVFLARTNSTAIVRSV